MKKQFVVGLVLATLIIGGVVRATSGSAEGEIENIQPGTLNITDTQAREAVMEAYPDAKITEVDLDGESGRLVYDVGLDNGDEVMVDAQTGDVLGIEQDDGDSDGGDEQD